MKTLYIICGATASGKTALAIELAKSLKTEVVSADSRQVFKQMNIGVARPTIEELNQVRHHMIACWDIEERYNVARYEQEAIEVINNLFLNHEDVVLCGGSGMYIDAIINGIDQMPEIDKNIREQVQNLLQERGLSFMQELLKEKDPLYYQTCDLNNPRRVQRALEVCLQTNKPFSNFRTNLQAKRDFTTKIFALNRSRQELIQRIDTRVDLMIQEGLIQEAETLLPYRHLPSLSTVGYREIFDYLLGKTSLDKAIELVKIHTRQYAKRQMTWFRKTENLRWVEADITANQLINL